MRPRFLPKPKMEPNEFDEYDREVLACFTRSVLYVGVFIVGLVVILADIH